MDSGEVPAGKSPRRELQGPRPAPLKVRKDSHKIRKPPVAPPPQPPPPVIIYTVSPKVIHTNPSEFMTLVQRLTGSNSSSAAATSSTSSTASFTASSSSVGATRMVGIGGGGGGISPAARFAAIEKARSTTAEEKKSHKGEVVTVQGVEMGNRVERTGNLFPGILSPGPGSLQPIPAGFFSPSIDPNSFGFFQDLSPGVFGNRNYVEGGNSSSSSSSFMMSPSTFFSPTPYLDLFNNFSDP